MADDAPTIRIIKKKKGDAGHHGGAWKVAYADFVTAMMAFFLVMWIVGLDKPVKQAIQSYFRDPVGFNRSTQGGKSPLSGGDQAALQDGKPSPLVPKSGAGGADLAVALKAAEAAIVTEMRKSPEFSALSDSVEVHMTDDGLRIELMEKTDALFFDAGSAQLKPRTVRLLRLMAGQLGKLPNPIMIEGHTDSHPLKGRMGYSNWELSADRANSARRAMEDQGLHARQVLAVRGYADNKLLRPDDPLHFSNRRVSILVAYPSAAK